MSDLAAFAAHCRVMAGSDHKPTCVGHLPTRWGWAREQRPDPRCPGCVTDADRELWTRLADEVDAYLDPHPTLWGER